MFIAHELKQKNIAEYVLYMWQVEDLIRAYDCSFQRLKSEYLSRFNYDDEQKEEMADWYADLIRMINSEGKREHGHLEINRIVVADMLDLHHRLLNASTRFPYYNAEYYKVLPFIVELRSRGDKQISEVETCLEALYGTMLLRLQGKEITPATQSAVKEITTFLGMLSDYYLKDKTEGLKFEEDEI